MGVNLFHKSGKNNKQKRFLNKKNINYSVCIKKEKTPMAADSISLQTCGICGA
jgi:hypothetical protein